MVRRGFQELLEGDRRVSVGPVRNGPDDDEGLPELMACLGDGGRLHLSRRHAGEVVPDRGDFILVIDKAVTRGNGPPSTTRILPRSPAASPAISTSTAWGRKASGMRGTCPRA